ncbi:MAG: hypothetical protein ACI854_000876 [Arenicella sp.]|jgi:uncharacterized protein YhdP
MKRLLKILLGLMVLYVFCWAAVAGYFSYADRHKGLLESNLSSLFERTVTIENVETVWRGLSPSLKIDGFKVAGDTVDQPALAFESLSAVLSPMSLLTLWPSFIEFAIQKPLIEIVSLENNQLQIGGLNFTNKRRVWGINQRAVSWLLDQQSGTWEGGEVVWRRDQHRISRYQNIDIEFSRSAENRILKASVDTPKGPLAFTAKTNGDLISDSQWHASLEVEGESGERLLTPKDFSVKVDNGRGRAMLKTLDVEQIRDFIRLTGLTAEAGWLLDAELTGRLHDVHLDFSGPLLDIQTWSLSAAASDIGFKSIGRAPAMNNLSGELNASADNGTFVFATRNAEFSWSRLYDKSFPINRAMGEFSWEISPDGGINIALANGEFEDRNARISNIQAKVKVDTKARKVSNFGQLFKLDSVSDLHYSNSGELLHTANQDQSQAPLTIDASAEFDVFDMSQLVGYLPNYPQLRKFRNWSKNAFLSGQISNGLVSYKGEVSTTAFAQGKANLKARAEFTDVLVDYAPAQGWPAAKRGAGTATIENERLTIEPTDIWINGDPLSDVELQIERLFQRDRTLSVRGKTTTSLVKGMDFLFKGPLIEPENRSADLPIIPESGWVDLAAQVTIQLNDFASTRVTGTAEVRDGRGILPEGVPVDDIRGTVVFTERKVESNNVRATFLGGEIRGHAVTVKQAQPPIVKLIATGIASTENLKPWVGEHLLTWFEGQARWKGSVLFDRDRVEISAISNLEGINVRAPAPLFKGTSESMPLDFSMVFGGKDVEQSMSVKYGDSMSAHFKSNLSTNGQSKLPSLFDNALISVASVSAELDDAASLAELKPGVNFSINDNRINLDDWLSAIIDLSAFEPELLSDNTDFLDAMRSISVVASNPTLLNRQFGLFELNAVSVDGLNWIGTLAGDSINGTMRMQPRAEVSDFGFKLSHLIISEDPNPGAALESIDYSLRPSEFPSLALEVDNFRLAGKNLGILSLLAKPNADKWSIERLELKHNGILTNASGDWVNNSQVGSISKFTFNTVIDEAEGAFNDMDFDGFIKKGEGIVSGELRWIGAPHEFDYGRLNGEFDASIKDGELVKIEPGGGKLLGLLNFNAMARRLIFDFRDVFASGLKFDRMRYAGVLADGKAILSEAFVLSPAVFLRVEGKVDLDKELVDLEVHVSPELGGNLALLSALANPAAGAFVFITQRIFKDEMRNSSFKSYRALGTWEDFEMVEIKSSDSRDIERSRASEVEAVGEAPEADIEADQESNQNIQPNANFEAELSLEEIADTLLGSSGSSSIDQQALM